MINPTIIHYPGCPFLGGPGLTTISMAKQDGPNPTIPADPDLPGTNLGVFPLKRHWRAYHKASKSPASWPGVERGVGWSRSEVELEKEPFIH